MLLHCANVSPSWSLIILLASYVLLVGEGEVSRKELAFKIVFYLTFDTLSRLEWFMIVLIHWILHTHLHNFHILSVNNIFY